MIESVKNIITISESSDYNDDLHVRSIYIESKLNLKILSVTIKEDIWVNEIYSIIIETMKYVSNPSSWSSDLPLLLWHRKDPPVIQIVDDGDDIITISYHINSAGDHITMI